MYERTLKYTTLLLLAAAVLGCNGDSPTEQEEEQTALAEVTVTGAMEVSYSSEDATFADDPATGAPLWIVGLSDDAGTDSGNAVLFVHEGQRPGEGTLDIGRSDNNDLTVAALAVKVGDVIGTFTSTSGTLEVTSSSSDFVSGTFEFTAEGPVVEGVEVTEGIVTVSGQFRARSR